MSTAVEQSDELLTGFIDESINALQDLALLLDEHRRAPADPGPIHSVFRAVHSIKGNAGFFGLKAIKEFSHALENTLDEIRNGAVHLSEDLARALLEAFDLLDGMLVRVMEGAADAELQPKETEVLARIGRLAAECRVGKSREEQLLEDALALAEEIQQARLRESEDWAARIRALAALKHGPATSGASEGQGPPPAAPADFLGRPCRLGEHDAADRVTALLELFLAVERGEYTRDHGAAFLAAAADLAAWAQSRGGDSLAAAVRKAAADFQTIFDSPLDLDPLLLSIVWEQLQPELVRLAVAAAPAADAAAAADADDAEDGAEERGAARGSAAPGKGGKVRLIRIREERVDQFLDDVSSLFITGERLKDLYARMAAERQMNHLVEELRQINAVFAEQTAELQKSVVALRKVPIRGLFAKFPRLARTLAANLGKKINVHVSGEEHEVDKSLVEDLDAPLTHMIRNVADHAIESPEERLARGADEAGNLWLEAALTRTHVIITVRDDGRGIDPAKLRRKAVEKGLLTPPQAEALSDAEAVELIFHPGFSTAEKVSEVSGRGVGMDVVRTKLREHNGDVHVESQVGVGTTFRLQIPLRQAVVVVDGLLIRQGEENYVLPFESIREIVDLDASTLRPVRGTYVATIHGVPYGAAPLGPLLGQSAGETLGGERTCGVLIADKGESICLLVDRILGQRKVVISSLQQILPRSDHLAGVAQLGGGRLALVLSCPDLIQAVKRQTAVR